MKPKRFCILGAGTYGSYLAHIISEKFPEAQITLVDVGDAKTKTEKEIGFYSKVVKGKYKGGSDGRFFGLGGTSAMWGGQLLFFSEKDFADCPEMDEIVKANLAYKDTVLKRFFKSPPHLREYSIDDDKLFIRKGVWLGFNQRNIFSLFDIEKKQNIKILSSHKVKKLVFDQEKVVEVMLTTSDGEISKLHGDYFYLSSGALESMRILHHSKLLDLERATVGFSDHVSIRCFKVKKLSKIYGQDFTFRFRKGSMITTRIIGEMQNVSFYAHPIFNEDFTFFQFLKNLIYKKKLDLNGFLAAFRQAIFIIPFVFSYLFKQKLFAYGSTYINIDIEIDRSQNKLSLSAEKDAFGMQGLDISFEVNNTTIEKIKLAKSRIKNILLDNGIEFEELSKDVSTLKLEDIYHPYNLYNGLDGTSFKKIYNPLDNLFVFHTGIMKRTGGINPTASLFCLIEKHIEDFNFNQ